MLPWFELVYALEGFVPTQLERSPRKFQGSLIVMSMDVLRIDESSKENLKVSISINRGNVLLIGKLATEPWIVIL